MSSVLVVDDEETYARNAARYLAREGHDTAVALTLSEGLSQFNAMSPDVVILDYRLPDGTGLDFITQVRARNRHVYIVLVTGHGTIELAVEAMKAGANDLLTKPVALSDLSARVEVVARQMRDSTRLRYLESGMQAATPALLGESPKMVALFERIDRVAAMGAEAMPPAILITGETGTGKNLVARAVHARGSRRDRPFVEINCAAFPARQLETELFGREPGPADEVRERRIGLIEAAHGGTLFLDEVGDMAPALQVRLLQLVEEGRFRRLGSVQDKQVNVQLIAATHHDLDARVTSGALRADLYFRLRAVQIILPALRERGGDVLLLARHFRDVFAHRYGRSELPFDPHLEARLLAHTWPGNVRELRNIVEQAVLLCTDGAITSADMMLPESEGEGATGAPAKRPSALQRLEKETLLQALNDANRDEALAARLLGVSRETFRGRLSKHGLHA